MTTVSYTDLRMKLAHFLSRVEEDCEEIVIDRGKGRKSVMLSLADYTSLVETAYLNSSPRNRKHLETSLRQAKSGKTVRVRL